jgi:serine/threonine protein kinase
MLSGGRLFDEGMYGCIFTPPLKCKNKQKQLRPDIKLPISKIILKDAAELEYSISKVIRKIPLWRNYFIVSESICEPALQQTDKEFKDCKIISDEKLSKFRILSMPYGGNPLNIVHFDVTNFEFMDFFIHLIESGAILNLFGIVHRDIHQGNILVDSDNVPRLIDFNLAIPVESDITSNLLKHQFNPVTGQEPPDSTLVNAINLGYKADNILTSIITKKPIIKKINNILNGSEYEMIDALNRFYIKSKSVSVGDDVAWFHTYWRTIDSWAIGANIIDLISKLLLWPDFSSKLKKISPKLFPVLKKMCAVSPLERIDCVQALNYLNPNSFIIRKYAKAWLDKVGTGQI